MNTHRWQRFKRLSALLSTPATDTVYQASRLRFMERDIGLPVKLVGVGETLDDLRPIDPHDFARALVTG